MFCTKRIALTFIYLFLVYFGACSIIIADPLSFHGFANKASLLEEKTKVLCNDYYNDYPFMSSAPVPETTSSVSGRGFGTDTLHKYLGYGTLIAAAGAAFSSSNEDLHEPLGYGASAMATITCITGFMEYSDYFDAEEGMTPYNIHIVSGLVATTGFIITSVLGAGDDSHGGIGGVSTAIMVVPIVVLKW